MSDVCFEINYLDTCVGNARSLDSKISDCVYSFDKIYQKAQSELSLFNGEGMKAMRKIQANVSEIRAEIQKVRDKKAKAQSKKQKEKSPPSRPSIPDNATPEQKNAIASQYQESVRRVEEENARIRKANEEIDIYTEKCDSATTRLEEQIAKLHQVEEALKGEIERAAAGAHEFFGRAHSASGDNSRIKTAMSEFISAIDSTFQIARDLCMHDCLGITSYSFNDRQFEMKNTHMNTSFVSSIFSGFSSVSQGSTTSAPAPKAQKATKSAELLVKERSESAFFDEISGSDKIKMPSANLHKLGGKKFINKMNALGYELVIQEDGSSMDINGMLHWEKKNV